MKTLPPNYVLCPRCREHAIRQDPARPFCKNCAKLGEPAPVPPAPHDLLDTQIVAEDGPTGAGIKAPPPLPAIGWTVRATIPFSPALSKNGLWRHGKGGRVFLDPEASEVRAHLVRVLQDALKGRRVAQNKLWLDIHVQMPNHKGDAVNVLDTVCDAVKEAVQLDDRWFWVKRLDWEVTKHNPRVVVDIGQDSTEDAQVCSSCGWVLPLSAFHGRKALAKECKSCRKKD